MACPAGDVRHTRRLRFIVYMSVVSLDALTWSAAALCRHIPRRACGIDHLDPVSLPVCLPRLTHCSSDRTFRALLITFTLSGRCCQLCLLPQIISSSLSLLSHHKRQERRTCYDTSGMPGQLSPPSPVAEHCFRRHHVLPWTLKRKPCRKFGWRDPHARERVPWSQKSDLIKVAAQ